MVGGKNMQRITRIAVAIVLIALVVVVTGCTSSNDRNYNDPQYQRTVGGGCGVAAGKEPYAPPELTQPVVPSV